MRAGARSPLPSFLPSFGLGKGAKPPFSKKCPGPAPLKARVLSLSLPVVFCGLTDADGRADAAQITHFD